MPDFKQCHKCKMVYPRHYLTVIMARGNRSGQTTKVLVCNACRNIIIAQQAGA